MTTIILIIILVAGLATLGYLIIKKIPDLKNLDINSLPDEKQDEAKSKILEAKFARNSRKTKERFEGFFSTFSRFFSGRFQKIKDKVSEMEDHYHNKDNQNENSSKVSEEVFQVIKELVEKKDYVPAEKKLIELISRDEKDVMAYEMLGDLYLEKKSYDQAEEIFKYLIKISVAGKSKAKGIKKDKLAEAETDLLSSLDVSSKVANYYDDLALIYEMTEKKDSALECYLKASSIEPNNPKYLDKLIELSIKIGDRTLARKTLNRLRQINPDNAKLLDFRKAIENI